MPGLTKRDHTNSAILDQPTSDIRNSFVSSYQADDEFADLGDEELSERPYTLVVSANDAVSLKAATKSLVDHLLNPRVKVDLKDLAYTLSERRTGLWHRAFLSTRTTQIDEQDFTFGKRTGRPAKFAFVFTGQGAQWPQMGNELLQFFPWTRAILEELNEVLQAQTDPPKWSLVAELTEARSAEHLRQPEFSQPLVTALQLCIIAVLESWGVKPSSVVGHSSGEIAAAYAAGYLDRAGAIKAAFYRGRAAVNRRDEIEAEVGMLAVGLGPEAASAYVERHAGQVSIACFNSPSSVTISGRKVALEALAEEIKADGSFARLLQVDLAYHSEFMGVIGDEYESLLSADDGYAPLEGSPDVAMFSSVTGTKKENTADSLYWKTNMVRPVRFADALGELIATDAPTFIIEIGPSGALAGPVSQVVKGLASPAGKDIIYSPAWARGTNAGKNLFDLAGRLFQTGAPIPLSVVNQYNSRNSDDEQQPRTIVDLPNYSWNHTVKYWQENAASKDWRNKKFITHDLLGAKIPGIAWESSPTWRKHLNLDDVPWLRDHKMGPDVLIPGAGLATMALEAMYQKYVATHPDENISSANELAYRFRNVKFERAVVIEENKRNTILLTLTQVPGSKDWHQFRINTRDVETGAISNHCSGLIRVQDPVGDTEAIQGEQLAPLKHPQSPDVWYKAQREVGMGFGPTFQKIKAIESVSGSRFCRTLVSMEPPSSKWDPQSYYPVHPAVLDGLLQTATPANAAGERSLIKDTMIPALVDDMIINKLPKDTFEGLSIAESIYTGRGRKDVAKSWTANIAIHDPTTGALLIKVKGLNYIRLDVDEKPDPHVFHSVTWTPDISLLTQDQVMYLAPSDSGETSQKVDTVLDLVAAKKPSLNVLEISLDRADTSSLWFDVVSTDSLAARAAYYIYDLSTTSAQALVKAQEAHEAKRNTGFHLLDLQSSSLGLPNPESVYDVVIVKASSEADELLEQVLQRVKPLLQSGGYALVVGNSPSVALDSMSSPNDASGGEALPLSTETSGSEASSTSDHTGPASPASSVSGSKDNEDRPSKSRGGLKGTQGDFRNVLSVVEEGAKVSLLSQEVVQKSAGHELSLTVAHFHQDAPALNPSLQDLLRASGWSVTEANIEEVAAESESNSTVLIIDELFKPVLSSISETHWESLKQLIATGRPILWVTKGGQTSQVTDPNAAMVQGLFRVARRENPLARLTTLDLQSSTSPANSWTINRVLAKMCEDAASAETEYAERDGIVLLQRIKPDIGINAFKAAEGGKGLEPVVQSLHGTEAQVRLHAEKIGTLQSLVWCQTAVDSIPMEPGMVEIEVMAVGVNFKVSWVENRQMMI